MYSCPSSRIFLHSSGIRERSSFCCCCCSCTVFACSSVSRYCWYIASVTIRQVSFWSRCPCRNIFLSIISFRSLRTFSSVFPVLSASSLMLQYARSPICCTYCRNLFTRPRSTDPVIPMPRLPAVITPRIEVPIISGACGKIAVTIPIMIVLSANTPVREYPVMARTVPVILPGGFGE